MKRKPSIAKRIFEMFLVAPVGYFFFKFTLPHPTVTNLDRALFYLFPVILALAFVSSNWDRWKGTKEKSLKTAMILVTAIILGVATGSGKKLHGNQVLDTILFGAFLSSLSTLSFYFASFQNRDFFRNDAVLNKFYKFATGCFIFSFFQIPIYSLFTGHFPPNFSHISSKVATIGMILGLIGPATPWLVLFYKNLIELDKRIRESRKGIPDQKQP